MHSHINQRYIFGLSIYLWLTSLMINQLILGYILSSLVVVKLHWLHKVGLLLWHAVIFKIVSWRTWKPFLHKHAAIIHIPKTAQRYICADTEEDKCLQQIGRIFEGRVSDTNTQAHEHTRTRFCRWNKRSNSYLFSKAWYVYSEWTSTSSWVNCHKMRAALSNSFIHWFYSCTGLHWYHPKQFTDKYWSGKYLGEIVKEFFGQLYRKFEAHCTVRRSRRINTFDLRIGSCFISSYGCTREVWRARKKRKSFLSALQSFLSALQSSRVHP